VIVRVKFRPNSTTYWRVAPDVEPPSELVEKFLYPADEEEEKEAREAMEEWLREEWGGGEWKIETVMGRKIDRSKTIKIKDEHVRYGVSKWVVWVKGLQSNRWYKADTDFDHPPNISEIIDAVGGGGHIKVVAYDDKNRQVESWVQKIDAPPPEWLTQKEDSLEKALMEALKKKQELELKKTVESIAGVDESPAKKDKKDKFDEVLDEIEKLATDQKIRLIEEFLSRLRKQEKKEGLSDILFTEPYKVKMEATKLLIEELAKRGKVDEAKELLKEIPDGTSALIQIMTAGANLANALAVALAGGFSKFSQTREEVARSLAQQTKQEEEPKKKEKEKTLEFMEGEEVAEKVESEPKIERSASETDVSVVEDESGWEVSFGDVGEN